MDAIGVTWDIPVFPHPRGERPLFVSSGHRLSVDARMHRRTLTSPRAPRLIGLTVPVRWPEGCTRRKTERD